MIAGEEKSALRRQMRDFLVQRPGTAGEDAEIAARLRLLPDLAEAAAIAFFHAVAGEPDLSALASESLAAGKRVCYPRANAGVVGGYEMVAVRNLEDDLVPGPFGVMEPRNGLEPLTERDLKNCLWLVPGLAFSPDGHRLGRGKGVYDRLLSAHDGLAVGVFYEVQKIDRLPVADHDRRLNRVVTEERTYGPFAGTAD